MMKKLEVSFNKTLRLNNVIKTIIPFNKQELDFCECIERMQSYIRIKGTQQIGPLIQYTKLCVNKNEELDVEIIIMVQCNNYLHNVESPYSMESIVRVPNAMYCRFIGPENKLKLANEKIKIEAFENDIELEDCSYTIFVDRNEEDETIVADVFIPRKDGK